MTEQEIRKLIFTLAEFASSLTRSELKSIFRMLIARGKFPECASCHSPIMSEEDFSWDHIYPSSLGGKNSVKNLQPMHKICNELKSNTVEISEHFFDHMEPEMIGEVMEDIQKKAMKKGKKKNSKRYTDDEIKIITSYKPSSKQKTKKTRRNHLRGNGWDNSFNRHSR